jgi:hypothetical protein
MIDDRGMVPFIWLMQHAAPNCLLACEIRLSRSGIKIATDFPQVHIGPLFQHRTMADGYRHFGGKEDCL